MPVWQDDAAHSSALAQLRERIPASEAPDDQLVWFLRDRKLDVVEAEEKLRKTIEFRKEFRAETLTAGDVASEAATGKSYVHDKRDVFGRPVLIVVAARHEIGAAPIRDSQEYAVYLMERCVEQIEGAGTRGEAGRDAETVLGLFDLRNFSARRNGDIEFITFLVKLFFNIYPKRIGQVLLVDAPFVFKPVWAVIKPLLGKYSKLVRFVSADEVKREYFTPDTLPDILQ
ncbi:unnamed protein product [Pedinophyceae sp. YPF-701]|nr:unnamed protein product [Pedinophyceae sp. YPF-701]